MKSGNKKAARTKTVAAQKGARCSNVPQRIDAHNWYYEYPGSILIVHEVRDISDNFVQTDQFKIPKRRLLESLERMQAESASVGRTSKRSIASGKQNPPSSSLEQKQ